MLLKVLFQVYSSYKYGYNNEKDFDLNYDTVRNLYYGRSALKNMKRPNYKKGKLYAKLRSIK